MLSFEHNLTTLDFILIALIGLLVVYVYRKVRSLERLLPYNRRKKPTKILSVVAGENIDTSSIEQALYSTDISYNLLPYSSVSQDSFLSELQKGFTVCEISSHGLNGQFRLGNTTLPISWLSIALRDCKDLEAILLLYCKSAQDLAEISKLGLFTIGLVDEVKDADCIVFARQFYYYLNKQFDYSEAFEHAKLHLQPDVYPKFICNDGRQLRQWQYTKPYQKITKDLLIVTFTASTIAKLIKTLTRL